MGETFVARVSLTINAPREKVWNAFVNPETIKQYMPVTSVVSEWREDSPIVWKSEFQGNSRPIFRSSGAIQPPENYQRVTIALSDEGAQTHLSVTERDNMTKRELEHSQGSWRMVLHGMKALLEGTSVMPIR